MKTFRAIGLMSGTSLDGVDVADVTFSQVNANDWTFEVNHACLYHFEVSLLHRLKKAHLIPAPELMELSADLGKFYADVVKRFLEEFKISPSSFDFIASHGQTVFHQPDKGYTLQIGNGPELAVHTKIPTVLDFRSMDVALGGNGAPLIPMADHFLFQKFADSFLNLGGFSNLSFKKEQQILSFDVCPVNIVINDLMRKMGEEYDDGGAFGKLGKVDESLLRQLNALDFYKSDGPKSLGQEWVQEHVCPLLDVDVPLENSVRTFYEHIAYQISKTLDKTEVSSVLITGGGANNSFLVERIQSLSKCEIVVPEKTLIDFKEAIGFAFLGLLKWVGEVNVLSSVTGSITDSSSGVIIYP
ncbi:anhydro-N-acetylmuramic acid kinase [Brumimicrobium aurantiacum]|uniref:Anhydro-N-acetylmuramic acid kinase n=1 Tax=Brumimicrobium aurantiacum TaxID=1737063 RepID=A0A3E1F0N1_9FLAO|nr:anhydro-N-acetylmuramic acid kinase [Brumimicrobium aurantiacum]RFC55364.1 anhydro-N-acetylmuramic acid kinase [Brumimicrobium aurantiacum]